MVNKKALQQTRNIGIIAHIDAGKTTVTERILYYSGEIHKTGEVHNGESTMDFLEQEKERGITIMSAVTAFQWNKHFIHLIDTPGHVDFSIEVERALRVLDGAVVVMCAVGGVEPQTETVWRQADKFSVPRIIFINKLDRAGANFFKVIEEIQEKLEATPIPIQIPVFKDNKFTAIIDLTDNSFLTFEDKELKGVLTKHEIPKDYSELYTINRESLIEQLADFDDELAEKYLDGEEIPNKLLLNTLRKVTINKTAFPVLCGSALKNQGIQPLIDSICNYLPSPLEIPDIQGTNPKTNCPVVFSPVNTNSLSALLFKVMIVDGRRMCLVRIYSGKIEVGKEIYNANRDKFEKVGRIFHLHADKRKRAQYAEAGDIVAIMGFKYAQTGDTLCEKENPFVMEKIEVKESVISMVIEPKKNADFDKLMATLQKMSDEDPTFHFREDSDTGEVIISGMGELHLEITVDRIKREYNVDVNVGTPKVVYKETITGEGEGEGIFDKKIGETEHFAKVSVKVSPTDINKNIKFSSEIEHINANTLKTIKQSLLEASTGGILQGYPIVGMHIILKEVISSEDKASEIAFRAAAMSALSNAMKNASPILLEPLMEVEVTAPEEFTGGIVGDLSTRNGKINQMKNIGKLTIIQATVLLSKMFGYSRTIRSLTQGRGTFTMQFHSLEKSN
jgi:elongation factor G